MRVLTEGGHLTTAIVAPENGGTGRLVRNWLIHSVMQDPADMLVYGPTEAMVRAYVKAEIEPAIDARPEMAVTRRAGRAARDLEFKDFGRMWAQFLPATYNNLINKSASRIAIGGLDACDRRCGDPYALADLHRQAFGRRSMLLVESHPTLGAGLSLAYGVAGIMRIYAESDQRLWHWPCPHCNGFWAPYPIHDRKVLLDWPYNAPLDEIRDAAFMICPLCHDRIDEKWRDAMNAEGVWVKAGQRIHSSGLVDGTPIHSETAGFWISGLMSPLIPGGIGALACAIAQASRTTNDAFAYGKLRDIFTRKFGWPANGDLESVYV